MSDGRSCPVEKRDGRVERLRATKLARSIHVALDAVGAAAPAATVQLAAAVLARLGSAPRLQTSDIAAVVVDVLQRQGLMQTALAYESVRVERRRRRAIRHSGA